MFLGVQSIGGTGALGIGIVLAFILALVSIVTIAKKKYRLSIVTGILTLVFSAVAVAGAYIFKSWIEEQATFGGTTFVKLDVLYGAFIQIVGAIILLAGTVIAWKQKPETSSS